MKLLKSIFSTILVIILIIAGCIFYGFKIEPYIVRVNEIILNKPTENSSRLKIAQISDIQIKEEFTHENLRKIVDKINSKEPDIVIFTGDLYDNYSVYRDNEHIIYELQRIKAKYAKIAIWGNRDYGGGAVRQYEDIMESAGFTLLKNENLYVTLDNDRKILFTGLDDALLGNPSMPDSTKIYQSDYDILLTHEPDVIENYLNYDYDIVLSGHSHGGQVNIPFIKNVTTSLGKKYTGGLYTINNEKKQYLYVNTGIGTSHIPARFGVVPEITIFDIYI